MPHRPEREFLGHPRGLVFVAGTELWERISFHGMQALLVLYMVERLLLPGHRERIAGFAGFRAAVEFVTGPLSAQALASQIFGLYVGFVYLMPVLGGALGDRVLGRGRAVALGAILMTVGHFCMAFERTFLIALLLLVLGAGLLRGNLISQLGDLYAKNDHRRENGFQIYYSLLNIGGFVAPLITGTLAVRFGWHYGFAFAGFGMLVGLLIYGAGRRYLPADLRHGAARAVRRLNAGERRMVAVLVLMLPIATMFWIAQAQIWNTYNLWARDHVDMMIAGWKMPVPWLQAIDSLAVVVLVPPMLRFWRWQDARGKEPDDLGKLALGCLLYGGAVAWLAASQLIAARQGTVPLAWAIWNTIQQTHRNVPSRAAKWCGQFLPASDEPFRRAPRTPTSLARHFLPAATHGSLRHAKSGCDLSRSRRSRRPMSRRTSRQFATVSDVQKNAYRSSTASSAAASIYEPSHGCAVQRIEL